MNNKSYFWEPYLKGVGQIMLQDNPITGLLFLLGIFVNSPSMGLAALVAAFVGTSTAKLLKYDAAEIDSGLYGFNATLIGVGLFFNFEPTWVTWVATVVLSAASAVVMRLCLRKKIPIFTFPFIVVLWISLYVFHHIVPLGAPLMDEPAADFMDDSFLMMGRGLGFGEVIFQGSLLSGIIFFLAVYINSPIAAFYGLVGSLFSVFVALMLKGQIEDVKVGMFSFNAVLCAIVFSGNKKMDGLYALIAVLISGVTENFMLQHDWAVLTFPFVLASWLTLIIRDVLVRKLELRFRTPSQ